MRTAALLMLILSLAACSGGRDIIVEVAAGDYDRSGGPVTLDLPASLAEAANLSLTRQDTGAVVPVQRLTGEPPRAVWMIEEPLAAGQTRRYAIAAVPAPVSAPLVTATDDRNGVTLRVGEKPILFYHRRPAELPEGVDPVFRTSGFIHPLYSPAGKVLTDDYPPDHYHQHGIFFAWVNTTFEGRKVDFWNQAGKTGTTEHFTIKDIRSGGVFAGFTVVRRYLDVSTPDGPKAAIEETWTVRAYHTAGDFLIDLISEQRTAGASPLVLHQYRYGGMAMRGAREWFEQPESDFLTSDGKHRVDGNHTRPNWVEMFGLSGGAPAGVLWMGSPENFRFPQTVRLHPTKPYFCFAPMVDGEFSIEPGSIYRSVYRIRVHDGPPDAAVNDRLWHDYATPPSARVIE